MGACAGDVLKVCQAGTVVETDCAATGLTCVETIGVGASCVDGNACVPNCIGRQCGSDGCGGSCGDCSKDDTCTADGQCVSDTCTPQCAGRVCGSDGCGGICGVCPEGQACNDGSCESATPCPDGSLPVDGKCPDGTIDTDGTDGGGAGTDAGEDAIAGDSDSGCAVAFSAAATPREPTRGAGLLLVAFAMLIAILRRRDHGQASA